MKLISQELRWSTRNYYVIHEDVTKGEPLLHSFYLDVVFPVPGGPLTPRIFSGSLSATFTAICCINEATMNVDYFSNISNSDGDFDNWGMFATEGGKSTNRQNMLEIIRQMAEELKPFESINSIL